MTTRTADIKTKRHEGEQRARPHRSLWLVTISASLCLSLTAPSVSLSQQSDPARAPARQEVPILRATTRLVEISVIAQDKYGRPITGLTRDDFVLLEDGREQPIAVFSAEVNRTAPPAPPLPAAVAAPGVFRNRGPAVASSPNVSVILFDALNTHILDQQVARKQIISFLKQLKPSDRVAIYLLTHGVRVLHDFTGDVNHLLATMEKFQGAATYEMEASRRSAVVLGDLDFDEFLSTISEREEAQNSRLRVKYSLAALESIAHHLAPVPGRKNLIWVSGGFPLTLGIQDSEPGDTAFRDRDIFFAETQRAARAVSQANISIYPVDARGLFTDPMDDDAFRASMPFFTTGQQSRYGGDRDYMRQTAGSQQRESGTQGQDNSAAAPAKLRRELIAARQAASPTAELQLTHDAMNLLADQTGGRAYYNRNDLGSAIREAIDEAEVSYILGFYPSHNNWNGRFHTLKVRVKRPDVHLRHRSGYFAYPDENASAPASQSLLELALASPLDARAIALEASLGPHTADGKQRVSLRVRLQDLWLQPDKELWNGEVDVHFSLTDVRGKVLWSDGKRVTLTLKAESFEKLQREGLHLWLDVPVRAESDLLRVAVRDARSGALGSVRIPWHTNPARTP
jgi:VWFA-related protein